jgi:hypothetical protein
MLKQLLVLTLAAALLAGIACGDDEKNGGTNNDGTPGQPVATATPTPPPQSTTGTVVLSAESVAAGGTVQLTGANWGGNDSISFYLLNASQLDDTARNVANGEAPKVGEATPDADGNVSFEFVLESSYTTNSGEAFAVESGEEFSVFALQGIGGSISDPFTVQ